MIIVHLEPPRQSHRQFLHRLGLYRFLLELELRTRTRRFLTDVLIHRRVTMAARLSVKQDYESLLDKYDTWLFDCDGVLWEGDRLIDGAIEVLQLLREKSMCYHYASDIPR